MSRVFTRDPNILRSQSNRNCHQTMSDQIRIFLSSNLFCKKHFSDDGKTAIVIYIYEGCKLGQQMSALLTSWVITPTRAL